MKIYIAGKISGLPFHEVKLKFHIAYLALKSNNHEPINPLVVSLYHEDKEWKDYMISGIKALLYCDSIFMLSDWKESKGAILEHEIASKLGLRIFY